ncbi:hypothetical protein PsorP6_009437 [Peronosclerospora sorghi]|uniref:Uncharacterized protein n=1 Tax=Peronosclerospora sorghi TaxID=230839 RepID=A0ACC0W0W6_9STRA|nr:hypothetical protein PsorP6_009437 [Peronosclerospora sorghi]
MKPKKSNDMLEMVLMDSPHISSHIDVDLIQTDEFGERESVESGKTLESSATALVIERFFTGSFEGGESSSAKPSQMALTSFHIATSVLRKLSNLEALSASPLTSALPNGDDAWEPNQAPFQLRRLSLLLHDLWMTEVMPIAVTILKNRVDMDDEAARYEDENERSSSDCRKVLGFSRSTHDSTSSELDGEALALRRALLDESREGNLSAFGRISQEQSFDPDSGLVESLVYMGFSQPRVLRVLREIQVNNVDQSLKWHLRHLEDEDDAIDDSQHSVAQNEGGSSASVNLCQKKKAAEKKEMKEDFQTLYCSLRDNFEAVCFQILRVQSTKNKSTT